jgi:DNA processing protein
MGEHGTAQAALAVLPEIAAEAGVRDYQVCPLPVVEQEMDWAAKCGAVQLCYGDKDYPRRLLDLVDAPPVLWAIGDLGLLERSSVALVGARNASSLGIRMARRLAEDLGREGHVIVSGLARGIDTAAHEAGLATGTIAVLAGGVDVIYPSENTVLGEEIGRRGLRLSEGPMGLSPQARHFPARNRIISGLSRAVVVVEAAAKSGSLITADMALEQGREVFAVPGHPFDARASGCNRLIRDGAALLRGARDVLDVLESVPEVAQTADSVADAPATPSVAPVQTQDVAEGPRPGPKEKAAKPRTQKCAPARAPVTIPPAPQERRTLAETRKLHQEILARLGPTPVQEDLILRDVSLRTGDVAAELTTLELEGMIARGPGGTLVRCK